MTNFTRRLPSAAPFSLKDLETKQSRAIPANAKLHHMILLSLRLARNILNDNTANRLYVMKMGYVPLMLTQLGYALKVAPTLTEVPRAPY
eukprot:7032603-Prymnesium_polylepis.1